MKKMKKFINYKTIALLALFVVFAVSCDTAQQDVEPIQSTDNYPIATFEVSDPVVSEAGGAMVTVDITFDKAIDRSVSFSGTKISGSATEHKDFEIHGAIVPAFGTSAQLIIEIFEDVEPEDLETIQIQIDRPSLASQYLINPISVLPLIDITIDNYVSENLNISFDWQKGITIGGNTYPTCSNIDMDILAFKDGVFTGDWQAATGDCPETYEMTPANYPDGEYVFLHDLYQNGFFGYGTDTMVPITATVQRYGVFTQEVIQDPSQAINTDDAGYKEGGAHNGFILKIIVKDGKYTVVDFNGDEIISGKSNISKSLQLSGLNPNKSKSKQFNKLVK